MFLLSLELDTNYPDSHDSTILGQENPLFNHATSLGRFFTLPEFMSQQAIDALNPSCTPATVPTSIMIANDHKVCAHNPAHNLAHSPFDNQVVTSIAPSKGELTSSFSFSTARISCCLDESTLVVSNNSYACYIKLPLYSGTPLKTTFGHIFGTYLLLCLIDAHGKTLWLGYHQKSLVSGLLMDLLDL